MNRFRQIVVNGFIIGKNNGPNQTVYLQIYTKEKGLLVARLKPGQKLTNRFQGKLELLSKASYTLYQSSYQNYSVTQIGTTENQHFDQISLQSHNLINQICKIAQNLLPENQPVTNLFELFQTLHFSLSHNINTTTNTIYFFSQFLSCLGILPDLKTCTNCSQEVKQACYYQFEGENLNIFCPNCQQISANKNIALDVNSRKLLYYSNLLTINDFNKIQSPQTTITEAVNFLESILGSYLNKAIKLS